MHKGLGDLLDILRRIVACDTTSHHSNLKATALLADLLDQPGIKVRTVASPDGTKENIWARIGPEAPGGVVLSGHTDVVPVEGQAWTRDPWTLAVMDGRAFGRGACDMKGFVAACVVSARRLARASLREPVYLAFSYDEEIGCYGVPSLISDLQANGCRPRAVIVGEPTGMGVVNAQKATYGARTEVRGAAAHSSRPAAGVSATVAAAEIALFLAGLQDEFARKAGPGGFDPPHATLNVGIVRGGVARNIVAPEAEIQWDCRAMPGEDPDEALRRLDLFISEDLMPRWSTGPAPLEVRTERLNFMPGLAPEPAGEAECLARLLVGADRTATVSYGTEAGFFQREGWSTIICGPGSIEQAHKPDEFIELDQLAACLRMLDALPSLLADRRSRTAPQQETLAS
ncbi:acetylornithine deacetylase [Mesorhizobium sp. IMUNJ 23232]|uniref:acetylornithine deacetylase n=1 Tax=Mesorhizobium sp. IMUNJ 23232 TaxID=3376064 RepID=UPI0037A845F7